MKSYLQILFFFLLLFANCAKATSALSKVELTFHCTNSVKVESRAFLNLNYCFYKSIYFNSIKSIHGVNSGYSIRVAKIWDDFDNGLYLSDLNIYNAANDGTVLLDDIIELSSIKLRRPNGTFADVEYRVVITSQGKVRMISKFNLDNKIHLFKIKENYSIE